MSFGCVNCTWMNGKIYKHDKNCNVLKLESRLSLAREALSKIKDHCCCKGNFCKEIHTVGFCVSHISEDTLERIKE